MIMRFVGVQWENGDDHVVSRAGVRLGWVLGWLMLSLIGCWAGWGRAQAAQPIHAHLLQRFEARTWTNAHGVVLRFRWFRPEAARDGLATTNRLPLVLILHGAVGRGEDNQKQFAGGNQVPALALSSETNQASHPCWIMVPQCPRSESWNWSGRRTATAVQAVVDFLETAPERHLFDTHRVYLVGLSMGGSGAWNLGAWKKELFAAMVPICGAGDPELAVRVRDLPIWCFHGDADPQVDVGYARRMMAELRKIGAQPRYTEYAGVGHNSYEPAFRERELLPWLFGQDRRRRPVVGP